MEQQQVGRIRPNRYQFLQLNMNSSTALKASQTSNMVHTRHYIQQPCWNFSAKFNRYFLLRHASVSRLANGRSFQFFNKAARRRRIAEDDVPTKWLTIAMDWHSLQIIRDYSGEDTSLIGDEQRIDQICAGEEVVFHQGFGRIYLTVGNSESIHVCPGFTTIIITPVLPVPVVTISALSFAPVTDTLPPSLALYTRTAQTAGHSSHVNEPSPSVSSSSFRPLGWSESL